MTRLLDHAFTQKAIGESLSPEKLKAIGNQMSEELPRFKMPLAARTVLNEVLNHSLKAGKPAVRFPDMHMLIELTAVSRSQVWASIGELETMNILKRLPNHEGKSPRDGGPVVLAINPDSRTWMVTPRRSAEDWAKTVQGFKSYLDTCQPELSPAMAPPEPTLGEALIETSQETAAGNLVQSENRTPPPSPERGVVRIPDAQSENRTKASPKTGLHEEHGTMDHARDLKHGSCVPCGTGGPARYSSPGLEGPLSDNEFLDRIWKVAPNIPESYREKWRARIHEDAEHLYAMVTELERRTKEGGKLPSNPGGWLNAMYRRGLHAPGKSSHRPKPPPQQIPSPNPTKPQVQRDAEAQRLHAMAMQAIESSPTVQAAA